MITVTEPTATAGALGPLSEVAGLVANRYVVGVTTNPSVFQAAIGSGEGYQEQLADLAVRGVTVEEAVRMMTTADARATVAEARQRLTLPGTAEALALKGRAALANARLAYAAYEQAFGSMDGSTPPGGRFGALERDGANRQRPLWASTGVKDPAYKDTLYVEDLVAPGTVNTMPEATLNATADHGTVTGGTVTGGYDRARTDLAAVARLGISYDEVVRRLEEEGVAKFEAAWQELLDAVTKSLDSKGVDAE
ncbi:transaldolase family protein [Streptomyces sp. NPDC004065]|uniref:transaldolase family protein n=1 Tax=Streptomyces sp. NPDC004065 TaxID=3364689 RepID=UPI00384B1C9F